MSDQTPNVIEGEAFTDAEIERLDTLLKSEDYKLLCRIHNKILTNKTDECMTLPDISERMVWERRGAFQTIQQLGFIRIKVDDFAGQIARERAERAKKTA